MPLPKNTTALHLATKFERDDLVVQILKDQTAAGISVNRTDSDGNTALHWAIVSAGESHGAKSAAIIEQLLVAGANPHARNNEGETPLDIAIIECSPTIMTAVLASALDEQWFKA